MGHICGHCRHYIHMPYNEDVCAKSGRIVPYMQHRDCFEYPGTKDEQPQEEKPMNETKTKICKECGRELPLDNFSTQYKSKDGHMSVCKECMFTRKSEAMKLAKAKPSEKKGHEDKSVTMSHCHTAEEAAGIDLVFTDQQLVDELRRRGYDVKCTKTIEL